MPALRNLELRHLSYTDVMKLSQILDRNDSWAKLMERIPKNLDNINKKGLDPRRIQRKYSIECVRMVGRESLERRCSPTMILLEEWGTSGRKRPTVRDLLKILTEVQLFRAADFIAVNILKEDPPKRPSTGPGAKINIDLPLDDVDEEAIEAYLEKFVYPNISGMIGIGSSNASINNRVRVTKYTRAGLERKSTRPTKPVKSKPQAFYADFSFDSRSNFPNESMIRSACMKYESIHTCDASRDSYVLRSIQNDFHSRDISYSGSRSSYSRGTKISSRYIPKLSLLRGM